MPEAPKLNAFSYVVLTLVGEDGAGPHDIVRMMRRGAWQWRASESQYYAEPKRLAALGLLSARKEPGITRERTVYELTDAGRAALRAWLRTPSGPPRIQNEPLVRALAAEYVEPEVTLAALRPLRAQFDASLALVAEAEEIAATLPRRERILLIDHRLVRRVIEAHQLWLDEIEAELTHEQADGLGA